MLIDPCGGAARDEGRRGRAPDPEGAPEQGVAGGGDGPCRAGLSHTGPRRAGQRYRAGQRGAVSRRPAPTHCRSVHECCPDSGHQRSCTDRRRRTAPRRTGRAGDRGDGQVWADGQARRADGSTGAARRGRRRPTTPTPCINATGHADAGGPGRSAAVRECEPSQVCRSRSRNAPTTPTATAVRASSCTHRAVVAGHPVLLNRCTSVKGLPTSRSGSTKEPRTPAGPGASRRRRGVSPDRAPYLGTGPRPRRARRGRHVVVGLRTGTPGAEAAQHGT